MDIPKHVAEYIQKHGLSNTGCRVLFFLLQHPEPISTADIAKAVGVSSKTVSKAIRKLKDAGVLQDDGVEAQKRRLSIPGTSPDAVPAPVPDSISDMLQKIIGKIDSLDNRFDSMGNRIDTMEMIVNHINTPEMPAKAIPTPEITNSVPISIPKVDIPAPPTESLIISLAKLASLKESLTASSMPPCDEFKALFGVAVPIGADLAAVQEMIKRKHAGKMEHIKAPLRYLEFLAGKVTPPATATPTAKPVNAGRPLPEAVDMKKIELENRINKMWNEMGDGEKKPFIDQEIRRERTPSRYTPPIECLARSEFKRQILEQHGLSC